ncbi:hypothetical protein ACXZ65_13875 [Streptomyces aculeolatus]
MSMLGGVEPFGEMRAVRGRGGEVLELVVDGGFSRVRGAAARGAPSVSTSAAGAGRGGPARRAVDVCPPSRSAGARGSPCRDADFGFGVVARGPGSVIATSSRTGVWAGCCAVFAGRAARSRCAF